MTKPGLTIAMIVRDERENLTELLPQLLNAVDDVVVVDTGSLDGSADLARELGARVFEQEWQDDFSRARNRGLDEVRTQHTMWFDADDRISVADLERIRAEVMKRPDAAFRIQIVSESPNPNFVSSCHQLRIFPSDPRHRFEGRVHEQIQPTLEATGTPVYTLDATVQHIGYVNEVVVARKSRRNLALSRREWEEGTRGIASTYHYVKAAALCGRHDEAARIARACVADPPVDSQPDILQSIRVTLGKLEWQLGHRDAAERQYREAILAVPRDPFALLHLGELLRLTGRFDEAVGHLDVARVAPVVGTRVPVPEAGMRRAIALELGSALESLHRPADAAEVYREALETRNDDVELRFRVVRALIDADEPEEIDGLLSGVPDRDLDQARFLKLRAVHAFHEERDVEAEQLYRRFSELEPHAPIIPLHLGWIALRQERISEAGTLLRTALARLDAALRHGGPDAPTISRMGDCYRGLGELPAARYAYREALRICPDLIEADRGLSALEDVAEDTTPLAGSSETDAGITGAMGDEPRGR